MNTILLITKKKGGKNMVHFKMVRTGNKQTNVNYNKPYKKVVSFSSVKPISTISDMQKRNFIVSNNIDDIDETNITCKPFDWFNKFGVIKTLNPMPQVKKLYSDTVDYNDYEYQQSLSESDITLGNLEDITPIIY